MALQHSPALQAALDHFKRCGVQSIEVPEWQIDGRTLQVFWTPLTPDELTRALDGGNFDAAAQCRLVQIKARDAEGRPLFSIGDLGFLHKCSQHVIGRLAAAMYAVPSIEDAEKN